MLPGGNWPATRRSVTGKSDDLVFSSTEVEELIERVRQRLTDGEDEALDANGDQYDEKEGADPDDHARVFDGENRTWTGTEVQEQLRILCETASEDWRAKLYWVVFDYKRELEERLSRLIEAKEHIACNRILEMEALDRLCLYERQISASFRHLVGQLERHQARRLGLPIGAPVALNLSVSHHGA
jgi:hypothetical protein